MPATTTPAATRSGRSAAHASTCGPPPDQPQTPKRPMPSASAIAAVSAATLPIVRPGSREELP